jgi:hypothetical protein
MDSPVLTASSYLLDTSADSPTCLIAVGLPAHVGCSRREVLPEQPVFMLSGRR